MVKVPRVGAAGSAKGARVPEQRGVPYLVVVPGGPGVPPTPGVPRLRGRAAPAQAVGTGWLSLWEQQERWPADVSALGPESIPGLQGSGSVPTWGVQGSRDHKGLQELVHLGGPGAVRWEMQRWPCHGLFGLLGAEDSLLSPGRNVGAPRVPSHPKSLPSSS